MFILLFIVLKFLVINVGLCFEFNQHCHKQIPYLYCLNTVIVVNIVVCGYFLHLLLLHHGDIESNAEQGMSKLIKTFHVATGMSVVY